ncbi:unnamed protein product [Rhizoctonia solani]|uniref:Nephrocystin 3-like N-terminal domain-containing protein n=1 Tax=Rhizoctonia solani TaxID=456999 RepID=A0A8H2WDI7_9AGAM|nr:unnamed protein product [Rhizoctonia solani]
MTAIAYQLAQYSVPFEHELYESTSTNPDILSQDALGRYKHMIQGPLSKTKDGIPESALIVIDGLDECEQGAGRTVLDILVQRSKELPLKIMITSRKKPESYDWNIVGIY